MRRVPVIEGPDGRRVLLDAAGAPVGRYDHDERGGVVYADLFAREPGVSAEHAAVAVLADLRGMRIAGDEELGRELIAAGGKTLRHGHLMTHDLAERPSWSDPPGYRLTDVDRPATDLVEAYVAAFPPGHVDHRDGRASARSRRSRATSPAPSSARCCAAAALAVAYDDTVVGAIVLGTLPGEPPLNGPWLIEVFRHPAHRGVGRALCERALALARGRRPSA